VDFLELPFDRCELLSAIAACEKRLAEAREKEFAKTAAARVSTLTEREREILECLVSGMPNKAIARELDISPRTVEFHRARVMAKMQAATLSELVLLGVAAGFAAQRKPAHEASAPESAAG
jgi:two-component system response regulator FixJ